MASDMIAPTIRRLDRADADAILHVAVASDVAVLGEPDTDLDDVLRHVVGAGARCFGIDGVDGRLVAYAFADYRRGFDSVHGDVRVHPDADEAAREPLLAQVRSSAQEIGGGRPLRLFANIDDESRQRWFESLSATPVRHFWRMVIDFDVTSPRPVVVPHDVVIRNVCSDGADLRAVFDVVDTAFLDHFGNEAGADYDDWVQSRGDVDPELWWLVEVGGRPAAALLGRELPDSGFVDTLGTLAEFRGRGLGRALLQTAFLTFQARGHRKAALGVDASNPTGAVGLYESVGMRAEQEWVLYEFPPPATARPVRV